MDDLTLTTFLAVWGAFLSSVAVGWNLYRDLLQKGRLKVSCYIGKLIGVSSGIDPNDYLVYNITNVGKEPVLLTHIGGHLKKTHFLLTPHRPLPHMLKPGEYILEYAHDLSVLDQDLKALVAIDSLGRKWKAPKIQVKKLKKDFASGKLKNEISNS